MKTLMFATFIIASAFFKCSKDEDSESINTQAIATVIDTNEIYTFDLGYFGDEEGATISKQAIHYAVSKLVRDSASKIIYTYQPAKDYSGNDEVEITSSRGSDGASANTDIKITTIKFTIVK